MGEERDFWLVGHLEYMLNHRRLRMVVLVFVLRIDRNTDGIDVLGMLRRPDKRVFAIRDGLRTSRELSCTIRQYFRPGDTHVSAGL
jgi:hypothetical protein